MKKYLARLSFSPYPASVLTNIYENIKPRVEIWSEKIEPQHLWKTLNPKIAYFGSLYFKNYLDLGKQMLKLHLDTKFKKF